MDRFEAERMQQAKVEVDDMSRRGAIAGKAVRAMKSTVAS